MTDTTEPGRMPVLDLPDTPAGQQLAWMLTHSVSRGRDLTVADVAEHMAFPPPWTPADGLKRFQQGDDRPARAAKVKSDAAHVIEVVLDYGDDKPWNAAISVESEPPHRIIRTFWSRAIPEDVTIRPAVEADGHALNDLEVRAPMQIGDTTLTYDRGDDFLGFGRLMGDNICFVAERAGQLLGVACGTTHPVRIGGQRHTPMLLHHLRVPVEHRKGGIFSSLNANVFGAFDGRSDGAYGYTALENAEGMRIGGPGTWSVTVFRVVIDCADNAAPGCGRWSTEADVNTIIDVLNQAHDHEEMFLPYTVESFTQRMNRAPELYSWGQLLIGDGAVVGVWPAHLNVTKEQNGQRTNVTRGVVLDHGFVPGAEGEFVALLRSWCGRLVELGHTELTFITSEGSASRPLVTAMASHVDPYSFRMSVPEPEGTIERGLYVDAIYF